MGAADTACIVRRSAGAIFSEVRGGEQVSTDVRARVLDFAVPTAEP
jgi:hypothetical protein